MREVGVDRWIDGVPPTRGIQFDCAVRCVPLPAPEGLDRSADMADEDGAVPIAQRGWCRKVWRRDHQFDEDVRLIVERVLQLREVEVQTGRVVHGVDASRRWTADRPALRRHEAASRLGKCDSRRWFLVASRSAIEASEKTKSVVGEALADFVVEVADLVRPRRSEFADFVGEERRGQDGDIGLE